MIKVPRVFPLKKIWHFLYLYTCTPNHQKKSVSGKKLNEPLSPPLDSKSQCAALMLPLGLLFTEACLLNYWAPLWVISLCCIWKCSLWFLLIEALSSLPRYFCEFSKYCFCLNVFLFFASSTSQCWSFSATCSWWQLCSVVVSCKHQSSLCVCYHFPSWWINT